MLPDQIPVPRAATLGWLKTILLVAVLLLGVITLGGVFSHRLDTTNTSARSAAVAAGQARIAVEIQRENALRTECFRSISAALDQARWDLVFSLLQVTSAKESAVIGAAGKALPSLTSLAARGGVVSGRKVRPCPPAVKSPP